MRILISVLKIGVWISECADIERRGEVEDRRIERRIS
jgi:hypothetical protein